MIKVNTSHIGPEGILLDGEENSAFLELSDVRTGAAASPLSYKFMCSMAGCDLVVIGTASVSVKAECRRCLKEIAQVVEAKSICHHYPEVVDKEMDITNDVREDILIAMPQTFLCAEGCKGLCPHCGEDLNEGPCKCKPAKKAGSEPSPWDGLDNLKI